MIEAARDSVEVPVPLIHGEAGVQVGFGVRALVNRMQYWRPMKVANWKEVPPPIST